MVYLLNFTGSFRIRFIKWGDAAILYFPTTYAVDRYEWHKRLPGQSYKRISLNKILRFYPATFQDEGYYCLYMYYLHNLQGKECFKLVITGK